MRWSLVIMSANVQISSQAETKGGNMECGMLCGGQNGPNSWQRALSLYLSSSTQLVRYCLWKCNINNHFEYATELICEVGQCTVLSTKVCAIIIEQTKIIKSHLHQIFPSFCFLPSPGPCRSKSEPCL